MIIVLQRDVFATLVPAGTPVRLPKETEVFITQELGGTFTVNVYGNLARIEAKDADALGREVPDPWAGLGEKAGVKDKVWFQLRTVFDPEIPVNIVDLGLIYVCDIEKVTENAYQVYIEMTLTAPGCGMGPVLVEDVKKKLLYISEIQGVEVELVFDPPWDRSMLTEAAQLQLGLL